MAANGFTLTRNPFNGELLTDSNCIYIDAQNGNDSNNGHRATPKQTLGAITNQSGTYLLVGSFSSILTINLNSSAAIYILGDLNSSFESLVFNISIGTPSVYLYGLRINSFAGNIYNVYLQDCVVNTLSTNYASTKNFIRDTFITNGTINQVDSSRVTIRNLIAFQQGSFTNFQDVIITDQIMLFNAANTALLPYYFTISNSIILKRCKWMWNGIEIPITWNIQDDETQYINDIKTSLTNYANTVLTVQAQKDYLTRVANNVFAAGTIIYNDIAPNIRIFNRYDVNDNVVDYTLNIQTNNPALFTSFTKSYVGAYRPSFNFNFDFNNVAEIDNNGNATGSSNNGTLLKYNDGIFCDVNSQQTRNKVSTTVLTMLKGDTITRFQGNFFRSQQFYCGALHTLQNVTKQNAILVEPYDTITIPAVNFPKFCIPIGTNVVMAYFLDNTTTPAGRAGTPILFNDLHDLGIDVTTYRNLNEIGTWAITNAMEEWDDVIELANVEGRSVNLRYFKLHLIVNRV